MLFGEERFQLTDVDTSGIVVYVNIISETCFYYSCDSGWPFPYGCEFVYSVLALDPHFVVQLI